MPLEIRELIIKVTVEKNASEQQEIPYHIINDLKREIIDTCVEKVLTHIDAGLER